MKFDAKALKNLIRNVVREELETQVPRLIKEHLSEQYIKKLVHESSSVPKRRSDLYEFMDTDEELEEVPAPKKNIDKGVYAPGANFARKEQLEQYRKKLQKENPLGFVFEDVKPLGEIEAESVGVVSDSAVSVITEGVDFSRFIDQMEESAVSRKPIESSYEAKMRELEQKRKALDVKVPVNK